MNTMHPRGILAQILEARFNVDELGAICFDLGIEKENLQRPSLSVFSRSLIEHCCKHEMLGRLESYLKENRKKADWDAVQWDEVCSYHGHTPRKATLYIEGDYDKFDKVQFQAMLAAYLGIPAEDAVIYMVAVSYTHLTLPTILLV